MYVSIEASEMSGYFLQLFYSEEMKLSDRVLK